MQLAHLKIQNFKGIENLEISFLKEGLDEPRPVTLLLGDNGSGKTTVLQAIALVLSLATRRIEEPSELEWPGFLAERVSSRGRTRVELEVVFEEDELNAISEANQRWFSLQLRHMPMLPPDGLRPTKERRVTLVYNDGVFSCLPSAAVLSQFHGRWFIRESIRTQPRLRAMFSRLGDVFWFDQHRNLMTLGRGDRPGIEGLREYLIGWWAFHTSPRVDPETDYLGHLETRFAELFPGTGFVGVEPKPGRTSASVADMYFFLERNGLRYDLAEMSSGEQAIFPLLYEFVRLDIARSVVLIDELELHLHPPQQQSLLAALRRIGPDCQFIVTTHSPYLEQVTPNEHEVRLPGGQRCL